jgi:hypothetical protein
MTGTPVKTVVLKLGALAIVGYAAAVAIPPKTVQASNCCNKTSNCSSGEYCDYPACGSYGYIGHCSAHC